MTPEARTGIVEKIICADRKLAGVEGQIETARLRRPGDVAALEQEKTRLMAFIAQLKEI